MKRSAHVLIAILVPGALAFYAARWALRKFTEWREDERMTIDNPTWHRDFLRQVSYAEAQALLSEPMPWAKPPKISDGPTSDYTRRFDS